MTTDVADTSTDGRKRGGPRGERPWRDSPTPRERVLTQSLADYVASETGREVSPETVRAVRFCLPKWGNSDETKKLRDNMDRKLAKAKLQDKREKALAILREAESELAKYEGTADLDDEDEDTDEDSVAEYDDDSDDGTDDDEDIFNESSSGDKVTASFG